MADTFFFYDTETSGINSRMQRIIQFGGQRTDLDLNPIDDPINILVKLDEDVLPDPYSVLVHGITPQKAIEEGISEPKLAKKLQTEVFTPNTIAVGFNSVRFDDEFVRNVMYRNFYDPYSWHWQDRRSRWDILDAMRMARALRPEGIKWPKDANGKATNRLELLASANNISHDDAHDALSDVNATIGLARLLKTAQPKLYEWLLKARDKNEVAKLVSLDDPKPFVYTSGRYSSDHAKTTIAFPLAPVPGNANAILVYDLRADPLDFVDLDLSEMKVRAFGRKEERGDLPRLPVKQLALNRCPAVAPLNVLDDESLSRIKMTLKQAEKNIVKLNDNPAFGDKLRTLWGEKKFDEATDIDLQIYDGFFNDHDKSEMEKVRETEDLADLNTSFDDPRLDGLLLRYKARHFPNTLSSKEKIIWEEYKNQKLEDGLSGQMNIDKFFTTIYTLRENGDKELLNALTEYGQQIAPKRPQLDL